MATFTIQGETAASTIDAVNDYLLIYNAAATAYRKINRNTFLSLTSAPVGINDTQTLTAKTLTTPTISGPTLSGTVLGTYTLGGTPTFPASVATLTGTQTLTNKTLTSPVVNGGTIDNATITVDSISGHTTSTIVTVGGVQMNNGVIGTANAVTSNAIAAGAVQPQSLQSGTGTGWSWASFTPSFTNLTIGNGSLNCHYIQLGKMVWLYMFFILGSTSAVSGDIIFAPPVAASANYTQGGFNSVVGFGTIAAGSISALAAPFFNASNASIHMGYISPSATSNALGVASASAPGTWATSSQFQATIFYEAS